MATAAKAMLAATGVACAAIGVGHLALGVASVPGETAAGPTVDSRERFYAAVFAGYGLAWLQAAREEPVAPSTVRRLAAIMAAGGAGRALSWAVHGRPHWFQEVLLLVELAWPVAVVRLAGADPRPD